MSLFALPCLPCLTAAQTAGPNAWVTEPYGSVQVIERTPGRIYLAGSFSSVGPASGQALPTNVVTGAPFAAYPHVAGNVEVVLADGDRGWFVGGTFDRVGDQVRKNLAYVRSDGRVSEWAPDPDGSVCALALDHGTLFVAGSFANIAGTSRSRAAAIDVARDRVLGWNPIVEGGAVRAVALDGNRVYLGGFFTQVRGQLRAGLAAVDREFGIPVPWNPALNGSDIFAIAVAGDGVYVGGRFSAGADSLIRSDLAAFDRTTGELLPWNWRIARIPECYRCDDGPFVRALAIAGGQLYLGGSFTHVDGDPRSGVAAVDLATHRLSAWDARAFGVPPYPYVYALAVNRGVVYVGGEFNGVGGAAHPYVGAVDAATGLATKWLPRPNGEVHAIAATDRAIYIGGEFTSTWNWQVRNRLAALDARSGALTPWNPNSDAEVTTMKLCGNTVYVTGAFSTIDEQPRQGIAAVDAATGHVTSWNPGVDAALSRAIWAMAMLRGTLYVGGNFYGVGGEPRRNLAAIDSATGAVVPWNPGTNNVVTGLGVLGDTLLVGGVFLNIGGQPRAGLAAVDTAGAILDWHPQIDCSLTALLLAEGRLIGAGSFSETLGVWRMRIGEFDPQSGELARWVTDTDNIIVALASANNVLYAGGFFTTIGGQARPGLAALDFDTGAVLGWDPQQNGAIMALRATENEVDVGGVFSHIAHDARSGFAILSPALRPGDSTPPASGPVLALAQNTPNPARSGTTVRFTLPAPGATTLTVYDIQGRRVATPLGHAALGPGPHEVSFSLGALRPGMYLYRLEAGGRAATRKMLVVR